MVLFRDDFSVEKAKGSSVYFFHFLFPENTVCISIALVIVNDTIFLEVNFAIPWWPVRRLRE